MVTEKKSTKKQQKMLLSIFQARSKIKQSKMRKAFSKKQRKVNTLLFLYSRNLCVSGTIKTTRLISPTSLSL